MLLRTDNQSNFTGIFCLMSVINIETIDKSVIMLVVGIL